MQKIINRFVLSAAFILALAVYFIVSLRFPASDLRNIRLVETYALIALSLLYLSLIVQPISSLWPENDFVKIARQSQSALIACTMFFALLHSTIGFFFLLGGFAGLSFLNAKFLLAIILSFSAELCLILLVLAGFDFFIKKFPALKKTTYSILYTIGVLILIHALLIGTHFIVLSSLVPHITFFALVILLLLEAARFDRKPKFGIVFTSAVIILAIASTYYIKSSSDLPSVSSHAAHLASLTQANSSKRYSVSFITDSNILPNRDTVLKFKIFDADTGSQIEDFDFINEKLLHLVIVDTSLNYFSHIHPELTQGQFSITTKFPKDDLYHLYLNFEPTGGTEQQFALTLPVGNGSTENVKPVASQTLTKTFGRSVVTLRATDDKAFNAQKMSNGDQILAFDFKDSVTGSDVTDLDPYLGAFGHLVLINATSYEYVHVHPLVIYGQDHGGPEVQFMPMGLRGPLLPGVYRVFGQFQRQGKLFVADYTINVE